MFTLTENKTTGRWEDEEICFGDDKYCTNKLSGEFERYILSFGEDEEGIIRIIAFVRGKSPPHPDTASQVVQYVKMGPSLPADF